MAVLPNNDPEILQVSSFIGAVVGTGLSTDLGTVCTYPTINKWSKYKPVIYPVDSTEGYTKWWKANNGMCGFKINTYTSPGSLTQPGTFFYQLVNNLDKWEYAPPYGGPGSPYRLGDFRNYNHDAMIPIGMPPITEYYIKDYSVTIPFDMAVSPDAPYNITISDLEVNGVPLSNYYLGGMLRSSTDYLISTSPTPISSGNLVLTMRGVSDSYAGTWGLYPFLSSVPFSSGSMLPAGTFLVAPLPGFSINIKEMGTEVQVIALGVYTNQSKTSIEYYVHLYNSFPNTITMNNIRIVVQRTTGSQTPGSGGVITEDNLGSETVPPKSEKILGPYTFNVAYQQGYIYWLAGKCDDIGTTMVATSYNPIEEMAPED